MNSNANTDTVTLAEKRVGLRNLIHELIYATRPLWHMTSSGVSFHVMLLDHIRAVQWSGFLLFKHLPSYLAYEWVLG